MIFGFCILLVIAALAVVIALGLDWREARRSLYRLRRHLRGTMRIWRGCWGSFLGHIRSQSPIDMGSVYLGQEFLCSSDGSYQLNPRTVARSEYIQAVLATLEWPDTVDLRIFLMGFDAGEEWTRHSEGISGKLHPSETAESWLRPLTQSYGHIPTRAYQRIKAFNDPTSRVTPASITGITRDDQ